jgi:hypothetical protein
MIQFTDLLDFLESNEDNFGTIKKNYMTLMKRPIEISDESFLLQCKKISSYGSIIIAYIESENRQIEIIAAATLIIEPKIMLDERCVAHIEDMVILKDSRYKNLNKILLDRLKKVAEHWNCDKLFISCCQSEKTKYDRIGFNQNAIQMSYQIEKKNSVFQINILAIDESCRFCFNIIQRNRFLSETGVDKKNIFIYFLSIKEEGEFDEIIEKTKILSAVKEKCIDRDEGSKILVIVHVVDLMQKYKITSNGDVDFLYVSTISTINNHEFEWNKDNEFLDNIFNEKYLQK